MSRKLMHDSLLTTVDSLECNEQQASHNLRPSLSNKCLKMVPSCQWGMQYPLKSTLLHLKS